MFLLIYDVFLPDSNSYPRTHSGYSTHSLIIAFRSVKKIPAMDSSIFLGACLFYKCCRLCALLWPNGNFPRARCSWSSGVFCIWHYLFLSSSGVSHFDFGSGEPAGEKIRDLDVACWEMSLICHCPTLICL